MNRVTAALGPNWLTSDPAAEALGTEDNRRQMQHSSLKHGEWSATTLGLCEILSVSSHNTHLSNGYKNVMKKFTERTGLVYKRKQFKNKWEKLRSDYGIWKQLEIQGASRFKNRGLQNEERLQIIFEDLRNTGEDHWNASSGVPPTNTNNLSERSPINVGEEDEDDINDDSEPEEVIPTNVTGKRGRVLGNPKAKKAKTSTGQWFQEQMGRIVDMNERTTASCESIARKEDRKNGCSIEHVMALVKACGATSGTNEHFTASLILTKTSEREMFMTLDTPEERFDWLRKKHEWMTRHNVPKFDSSDSDDDGSSSDDEEWTRNSIELIRSVQNNLFCTALIAARYYFTYLDKNEARTSRQSGYAWLMETLDTPGGSHKMFRMDTSLFYSLHDLLVSSYGLKSSLHMNSTESLAIFLVTCGHGLSNSALQHIFKHSGETISRKFDEVLNCIVAMCEQYIRPIDPNFSDTHPRILSDRRMMPFFKDCIGALDGTHITTIPPSHDFIRYIGRSGKPSQNVLAVVDFDLRFTYASIGQPGSMHDTSVLFHALNIDSNKFPHPPQGKYYNVDAGYPNRPGYLAPYKGQRYHVPDWRKGPATTGEQELFNHLHSSIRNVVERTFGVWKMKWRILLKMPSYPMDKQKMIVAATMCLHNYIRENHQQDKDFQKCDRNIDYVPTIPSRYGRNLSSQNSSDTSTSHANDRTMDKFRDDIAREIFLSRRS
ncbi:hypothetical protein U9M48_009648 [Paspalum notatum var. saurae]|uniref:DDE Tnp4 domain-containing protein n=1 Tax=Paspalum notatum var. saurae TaxID=547442 RepID=A0AAQ3ST19_PASNO